VSRLLPAKALSTSQHASQIARLTEEPPYGYADLRSRAIALTQQLSGEIWTDYNHHDPGVTLLEALCFAMTEGVYAANASVADLLTAENGSIQYHRHGLHAVEEILPCRPTTELDLIRMLLDRVPQIRHLRLTMAEGEDGIPDGVWRMALRAPANAAGATAAATARTYWAQRNLCEDMPALPTVLKPLWCSLKIELSITGSRDTTEILLELVQRCTQLISAAPPRQDMQTHLAARNAQGEPLSPSELFDGPFVRSGWISPADLARDPANRLFFNDLARMLVDIDGIEEIHHLSLTADGLEAADGALPWYGEDWALQLRWPNTAASLAGWHVIRRGSRQPIDVQTLLRRMADELQVGRATGNLASTATAAPYTYLPRPVGRYLAPYRYFAAYNHLPPVYHGAEPIHHGAAQPAMVEAHRAQFMAYQALLEQWLAHGDAQLQQLRALYNVGAKVHRSYAWQMLDSNHLPGLDALYVGGKAGAERCESVFVASDAVFARRGRMLDHLLALHGESCGQSSIQVFGWYYSPDAWTAHLFECKRQFLLRIVRFTRDRQAGIDYSRPSLDRKGNTAVFQERVSLLLGLAYTYSRRLMAPMAVAGIALAQSAHHGEKDAAPAGAYPMAMWSPLRERIREQFYADWQAGRVAARLAHYFPTLDWQALPPMLLRCAAQADHYGVVDEDAVHPLWLGPDEAGRWWPLRVRLAGGNATAPGLYLHEFACYLQRESEGIHLIEHILLRPVTLPGEAVQPVAQDNPPAAFFEHQVSVVWPAWTARGADRAFRYLAWETVSLNCPAHILPRMLWLDATALAVLEHAYQDWLAARQAYCVALCDENQNALGDRVRALNRCAGGLACLLWAAHHHDVAEVPSA